MKILKCPMVVRAIFQGRKRLLGIFLANDKMLEATVNIIEDAVPTKNVEFNAIMSLLEILLKNSRIISNIPTEANMMLKIYQNNGFMLNLSHPNMNMGVAKSKKY
ncbi:MAG: hypothetical protein IPN86_04820 [Saprospiraceae bacterium]|nr:hypothetical protein [Saprospiraceae bacterium]